MKKLLLVTLILSALFITPKVSAQEVSVTTAPSTTIPPLSTRSILLTQAASRKEAVLTQAASRRESAASNAAARKDQQQATILNNLRMRALAEIDRRISSLNGLITRVTALKKLSDTQKTSLTTQIQAEVANLTNLKTKIQGDTDLTILREDTKSIVATYRIYALFVPKIYSLTAAEAMLALTDKMMEPYNNLKTRVDEAKVAGADTADVEEALATMLSKIDEAKSQSNDAINTVSPLTPSGYPANRSSLDDARESLRDARRSLVDAKLEGMNILRLLRKMPRPTLTPEETSTNSSTTVSP